MATAFAAGAMAQEVEAPAPADAAGSTPAPAAGGGAPVSGLAAEGVGGEAPKRAWIITPRVRVGETLTDNVTLGVGKKQSDQVTEVSPGITIDGRTARLKLHFDYGVSKFFHAQQSDRSRTQNSLNSFGTLEAVERWLFLDFSGNISQQSISAFQPQAASGVNVNANSTETSTFRLSPYIRGRLGGYADYQVRYDRSSTHSESSRASNVDNEIWSAQLSGDSGLSQLAWSLAASTQTSDFSNGRETETEDDRVSGTLYWRLTPEWRLVGTAGRESNNYASPDKISANTHGYGFDWTPTERTLLSALKERRFFGDGHRVTFSHRMPRTAWRYTDSRDVTVLPNQLATASLGTYTELLQSMFASVPDEALRDALVAAFFQQNPGISPTDTVQAGFLTNQATLQRRQELSFIITGARNTVTLSALRSEQQRLSDPLGLVDDSFSTARTIKQQGFNVNWSHQLTSLSSMSAAASRVTSKGSGGGSNLNTVNKSLTVNFYTQVGAKSTASLGVRRNVFDSETSSSSYTENAVIGTLTARF